MQEALDALYQGTTLVGPKMAGLMRALEDVLEPRFTNLVP